MAARDVRDKLVEQAKQNQLVLLLGQDWPQALTGVFSNSELAGGLAAAKQTADRLPCRHSAKADAQSLFTLFA